MTRNLEKLLSTVMMAGLLGSTGCLGSTPSSTTSTTTQTTPITSSTNSSTVSPTDTSNPANPDNTSSGGTTNTFNHENDDTVDPFEVLARIQQEGPPEISTRMHDCGKMKYATVGNVLSDFGIDPTKGAATSAGGLYMSGAGALGKVDYANRLAEGVSLSTAGAVRLYDIFVAAAPTIVSGMPTMARCMVAGAPTSMFDTSGACTAAGVACITGAPSTQAELDLCNSAVTSNSTDMIGTGNSALTVGQIVAVSTLLAAAHSCE